MVDESGEVFEAFKSNGDMVLGLQSILKDGKRLVRRGIEAIFVEEMIGVARGECFPVEGFCSVV